MRIYVCLVEAKSHELWCTGHGHHVIGHQCVITFRPAIILVNAHARARGIYEKCTYGQCVCRRKNEKKKLERSGKWKKNFFFF